MAHTSIIVVSGVVSTLAGGGGSTLSGYVDGVSSLARFFDPIGVAMSTAGDLFVADTSSNIRKVSSSGTDIRSASHPLC